MMKISKVIDTAVKTVSENKTLIENTQNITEKVSSKLCSLAPDLQKKLAPNAKYHEYSAEIKEQISNLRNRILQFSRQKNNPKIFENNDSFISVLVTHCDDEKMIGTIFKNIKNYNTYINTIGKLNSVLQKTLCQNSYDKNKILVNLTLMKLFNQKSFKSLCNSAGFNEILAKRMNLSYLKDVKPADNIDENFFYKLFENIENSTNERLMKSGIDVISANKFIKLADDEICKNPKVLEEYITKLEKAKNPELIKDFLNKFELTEENFGYIKNNFLNILDMCEKSPDIVKKALQIQNASPFTIGAAINLLGKEGSKITDDVFKYYLNLTQNHPQCCTPATLTDINSFLSKEGTDEKLLKEIFEKSVKTKNYDAFTRIAFFTNENNLEFLKKCLKNETLDTDALFKLKIMGINPAYENQLDEICEHLFQPLLKVFKKHSPSSKECDFIVGDIVQMKFENPDAFKKLQSSKILDLVLQERINPRILTQCSTGEFTPEILSDVNKLLNGEGLIKKFGSEKDIIKNTVPGDVASVKGKLYINNNGKLEHWNMTEEKFNELFPLVDRFSTLQGRNDCYFISVLNSLYYNPKTRGSYYKMFEQKGNDIFVTIPAYKNYGGAIKFSDGEIQPHLYSADAAKNVQMLERAFAKTSFRDACHMKIANSEDPRTSDNLDYLQRRIFGGNPKDVLAELLSDLIVDGRCIVQSIEDKTKIQRFLENFGQNPRYMINEKFLTGRDSGHSVSIKGYEPESKTVTVIDPFCPGIEEKVPLNTLLKDIYSIIVTRFL